MKPQRMRITHELVSAYGMLDKMHVLVSVMLFNLSILSDMCREQNVLQLKP